MKREREMGGLLTFRTRGRPGIRWDEEAECSEQDISEHRGNK